MIELNRASKIKLNGAYTDEFGIVAQGRYELPTGEQDIEFIDIKGRDGELTKKYGFKNILLSVVFSIQDKGKQSSFKSIFRKAKAYVLNAKTFQVDDDDEVYYKIKAVQIDDAENRIKEFGEFTVNFTLDPFAYEINNPVQTITSQTTINNLGYESQPIMTVHCAGTGNVYVNDIPITIKDINGTITIDSEMMNAYRKGTSITNLNNHMVGDFPVLRHGNNVISFDGDISKIELIKNWRWV